MKNRLIVKTLLIMTAISILLCVVGFSYAYFSIDVNGDGKYMTLDTAELRLKYTDDVVMSLNNAIPGEKVERTFTVENIGTKTANYNIVWKDLINTIDNYDLHLDMKCKSYKNYGESNQEEYGTCDSFYKSVPTTETSISKNIRRDIEIEVGVTQVYNVTITFLNRTYDQSENLNKSFSGKIDLEEYIDPSPKPIYFTYDGELVQGTEYVNGQYTYRYMQGGALSTDGIIWSNSNINGWGVQLTDRESTNPVTSKLCTYINNIPIVTMNYMFNNSNAASIDLSSFNTLNVVNTNGMFWKTKVIMLDVSSFNTKNVVDMTAMFQDSLVTKLDLSNFDTSNVISFYRMFYNSQLENLDLSSFTTDKSTNMVQMFADTVSDNIDLSSFNTGNVTDMKNMFAGSKASLLDLSNFDTSNVKNMNSMFNGSQATVINLNNFNTVNVKDMGWMFWNSKVKNLDLSSWNTSKVTDMNFMFFNTNLDYLDISSFNTSNVTNMGGMFCGTVIDSLNLSNFDTSKATNMSKMFWNNGATHIYGLENFDTSNVTSMFRMFDSSKATTLDLSSFNILNVTEMTGMFYNSKATVGYAKDEETVAKFNDNSVTSIPNTLKFVVKH